MESRDVSEGLFSEQSLETRGDPGREHEEPRDRRDRFSRRFFIGNRSRRILFIFHPTFGQRCSHQTRFNPRNNLHLLLSAHSPLSRSQQRISKMETSRQCSVSLSLREPKFQFDDRNEPSVFNQFIVNVETKD